MTFAIFATSLGLSLGCSWLVLKLFPRLGLMDRPEAYGHKRKPIPYPGGVALFVTFVLGVLLFLPVDRTLVSILTGATLLAVTSFIDDRRGLSPYLRLAVQFVAAALLVLGGIGIVSISNPFGDPIMLNGWQLPIELGGMTYTLTLLADLLTVFWVMTMVNAFNWIDGVPGMTSSVSAVAALVLLMLSIRPDFHFMDQSLAIALSAIVLGMSIGFLVFDFPAPRMLMGDTGSMLLGFLLATIAIVSGGKIATTLLVLGFPIIDFVWVILRRLISGQSPFKGDLWHFHHRLLKAGLSERVTVIFFAATAALFGVLALSLHTEGKVLAFAGILAVMVLLASFLYGKD